MRSLFLFWCILNSFLYTAQNQQWFDFTSKDNVRSMAVKDNEVWIGSCNGIVVRDTSGFLIAQYTRNEGLVNNFVTAIAIDSLGNKWIGTNNGVSKFDGTNWTTYNMSNSSIVSNEIKSIAVDLQNNVWIGSEAHNGFIECVAKFDGTQWTRYNSNYSSGGSSGADILDIDVDNQGNVWFISLGGNPLTKYDGTNFTRYTTLNFPQNFYPSCMAIDSQGNIWLGTNTGVSKFDGINCISFNSSNSGIINNSKTKDVKIDTMGSIWLSTDMGIVKYDGINWTNYTTSNSGLHYNYIHNMVIDLHGNKWFGSKMGGVSKFDGNNWVTYSTQNSELSDNVVYDIKIDNQNNKWIVTHNGLSKFDGQNWTYYNPIETPLMSHLLIDNQNNKWVGHHYGISKFDGLNWTHYTTSNSPITLLYGSPFITQDLQGNIWVGGANEISKFDGSNWFTYNISNSVLQINQYGYIRCLETDPNGNIWVGTAYDTYKFDGSYWSVVSNVQNVYSIAFDQQGNTWIGTSSELKKFDGSNFTTYSLSSPVNKIIIDEIGNIWFGGDGLTKFDVIHSYWGNRINYSNTNSGLMNNSILTFSIDHQGNKWIGNKGAETYDRDPYEQCITGGLSAFIDPYNIILDGESFIRGKVYYDKNENQLKDSDEIYLAGIRMKLTPYFAYSYTNANGEYSFIADTNNYYSIINYPQFFWHPTTSNPPSFILHDADYSVMDLGINGPDTTIMTSHISLNNSTCSTEEPLYFSYTNNGTMDCVGQIILGIPSEVQLNSSIPAYDSIVSNKFYYHFDTLNPTHQRQIILNLIMPSYINMGDTLMYTSTIITSTNYTQIDTLKKIVTCSYDPNTKEINPLGYTTNNYTLKNEDLIYTIHFQNTGNDTAFHIRIEDTLSAYLDKTTFEVLANSHNVNTTMTQNGILNFDFYNILLPDSTTNELLSHGFVSYKIRCLPNIPDETIITNTGYIYFDFNPAIVTNTTVSNMVTAFPIQELSKTSEIDLLNCKISIIPHPLFDESIIRFENLKNEKIILIIRDLTGREIFQIDTFENSITLHRNLFNSPGLYIFDLNYSGKNNLGKLLVK